jgi:7,8-dihydropterin-6-yl-methyl-4-(beta-D-ribofuranosyl)aminobenzene 5'-phosphate synthase
MHDLTITVVFDNNPFRDGLGTEWGFAAVISGAQKTILFDTGASDRLLRNMERLKIGFDTIDVVVLSHAHGDHTGGLVHFLGKNHDVCVYLLKSSAKRFKDRAETFGAEMVEVVQPVEICENVYSTGQLGKLIKEQALVVRTQRGLVVMTGCAHPGIARMLEAARKLLDDDVLLAIGGFHLEWATQGKIEKIISAFEAPGVRYVAGCHCMSDRTRALFQSRLGGKWIEAGVGKVVTMADLK